MMPERACNMEQGFYKDVGARLRTARKAKRLSLEKLSEEVKFATRQSLGKYENGIQPIPLETLVDVCRVLEVKPDQVLGVEGIDKEKWMRVAMRKAEEMFEELYPG